MSIRTMIFAAAAVAVSAFSANATTLVDGVDYQGNVLIDGSLDLNFTSDLGGGVGVLVSDNYTFDQAFNLRSFTEILIDPKVFGTGSLTISTFVDPFSLFGIGAAQVLLSASEIIAGGLAEGSVTAKWGDSAVIDLSSGQTFLLGTTFEGVGEANAQDLVISWNVLESVEQVSVNIAAVPLPAGILLLGTALGGLGLARRRRKS